MENKIITIIVAKPFKLDNKHYFCIDDRLIEEGTIDPNKFYELPVREFDETK